MRGPSPYIPYMIVTSEIPTLVLPESKVPRSAGLHQSTILRAIGMDCGLLRKDEEEEVGLTDVRRITDPVAIARMCLGLAWESFYIPTQLPDVLDHPEEFQFDGVYMSMDGESISVIITQSPNPLKPKIDLLIHEVKCTYKSINTVGEFSTQKELTKNWLWLAQLKNYCKAKRTRYAKLHVMFVCGDYKRPIIPIPKNFNFEFTQQELDDNWSFITDYAAHKMREDQK